MNKNQKSDGMNYAPQGRPKPVCKAGDFPIAAIGLDHGHIYGMCNGLSEAGATLSKVWDPNPAKMLEFKKHYPDVQLANSEQEILQDKSILLVASAAVPADRCALGLRVMEHGKDYFTDKAPLTSLAQLDQAKAMVRKTGKKYAVYYSERLHVECAIHAGDLVKAGAIGRILQVIGMGPHRLNASSRPAWFFERERYGGILCDIGSHQIEQYLYYSGATDATVVSSQIANHNHGQYPELEDFGDATLRGNNGTSNYFRVDWFTPDGLATWGDGRTFILGTEGYIELRKYIDIGREKQGDHLYLVDGKGEHHINVAGQVGFPYFGQLIIDCLTRSEKAMTQEHAFKAAELCIRAQEAAHRIEGVP